MHKNVAIFKSGQRITSNISDKFEFNYSLACQMQSVNLVSQMYLGHYSIEKFKRAAITKYTLIYSGHNKMHIDTHKENEVQVSESF